MKFRLFLDLIAFSLHSVNLFCHSRAKGWWKTYLLKMIMENQKWLLLITELLEISQHAAVFDLEMQTQDCVGGREKYIMSWLTSTYSCSYVLDARSVFVWKSIFLGACLLKTQLNCPAGRGYAMRANRILAHSIQETEIYPCQLLVVYYHWMWYWICKLRQTYFGSGERNDNENQWWLKTSCSGWERKIFYSLLQVWLREHV